MRYGQSEASANIDETEVVHICRAIGEVVAVEACQSVVATGATGVENTKVQVIKQTGATTTSIMTTPNDYIQLDLNDNPYVPSNGTLDGTNKILANNDVLKVVVTQNGTLGTPVARGLCVNITLRETPPGT